MPRISDERRAARREQIVRAALRCGIRSGLDGMTMAEVVEESGLSAGAVYGYFDSKTELIAAVVDSRMDDVVQILTEAVAAPEVPSIADVMRSIIRSLERVAASEDGDLTVMLMLSWAEASKDASIRKLIRPRLRAVLDAWTELARRHQAAGTLDPGVAASDLARVLHSSVPGYLLLRVAGEAPRPQRFAAGWEALTEWSPTAKK